MLLYLSVAVEEEVRKGREKVPIAALATLFALCTARLALFCALIIALCALACATDIALAADV